MRSTWLARVKLRKDHVLFLAGLAGVGYETFAGGPEKPTLLILFAGMLGLPMFLRADEKRHAQVPETVPADPAPVTAPVQTLPPPPPTVQDPPAPAST